MRKPVIYVFLLLAAFATNADYYTSNPAAASAEQPKPELVTQTGHVKNIQSIAISPDNQWIATGGFDSAVKIWSAESGRELRALSGHKDSVKSVAVSPDGKLLVSGANDGTVKLWNVATGVDVGKFAPIEGSTVEAVAYSRDGTRIAAGGSGKVIIIRDASTGADIARLPGHTASISALDFSPDGSLLASGSSDRSVKIWDIAKAKANHTLSGNTEKIRVVRFSPTGEFLASGGTDKSVRVWKTADGTSVGVDTSHASEVQALYFSDAAKLVSGGSDRSRRTWDITLKAAAAAGGSAVDREISATSAAFSPDGSLFVTGEGGGKSTLFKTATGEVAATLENYTFGFSSVAFSSDRHWMAAASDDRSVKLWDLETGESLPAKQAHKGFVTAVVFEPGKRTRRMISGSMDGKVIIWDTLLPKPVATLDGHFDAAKGRTHSVRALALGGKGKLLASGGSDKRIALWDVGDPKAAPRYLTDHKGEVTSLAISADERTVVSSSADGTVKVWLPESGSAPVATLEPQAGTLSAVALSPDGKLVAAAGSDKQIRIWEVESRRPVHIMPGHAEEILSVAFSPDGTHLISSSRDKTARTWNVASGQPVRTLNGHAGSVRSSAFSSDGKWLTTASDDGTLMAWKADTGERGASLISLRNGEDWLVATPLGFFDGSPLSYSELSWRFEGDTFNVKPVEVFFNEFYKPGLLSVLFNNRKLPNTNIATKNRQQPKLLLTKLEPEPGANPRELGVRIDITDAPAGAKDVRLFRNGTLVKIWRGDQMKGRRTTVLETKVPMVAGKNRITAYAFNVDDVKSIDQAITVIGPPDAPKGVAYVLAVGVNSYANKEFDLAVAVKDARTFAEEFKGQQERLGTTDTVETIIVLDEQATKKNILDKISQLGPKLNPEDSLTIFYAGHGMAVEDHFYLIPHDIGYTGDRPIPPDEFKNLVGNWISDEEIGKAVENIYAGQLLLVIDACNSGKALDVADERRGPMNSKGLAQVAYEKGMYILTAAQGFQDAKEDVQLGHGYLTHALVVEGLKNRVADSNKDNEILMREWLDFATERVPEIDHEEIVKGAKEKRRKIEEARLRGLGREKATGDKILALQRPRVFYRRESEASRIVVARY